MREIPSVARIGREAIPLGEESAPIIFDVASVIEADIDLSAQTHGPS